MYRVGVLRDFIARHYLIGGDWGEESKVHSHKYRLELELRGSQLNQHQYLVDIVAIEQALDSLIWNYRDKLLNDLPEFAGKNPSLEKFAELFAKALAAQFLIGTVEELSVTLWENSTAWAGYEVKR
jgi:6-pyruvoyltetrahydropterin/6-carboxytetrahydropterin synthase